MKKLLLLLTGVVLISGNALAQELDQDNPIVQEFLSDEQVLRKIEKSVVSIVSYGFGIGTCSGVLVMEDEKNSYVLSAKHCIDSSTEEMKVEDNKVKSIFPAMNDDIVYLVVEGKIENKTPAPLALYNSEIGDKVYHFAYPNWQPFSSIGQIIKVNNDWQFIYMESHHGCSGGGVFNSKGEVIGILWGFKKSPSHDRRNPGQLTYSIIEPVEDIYKFLKELKL